MRHKGVTLLETIIAITIMSIMAGVMALSSATVGQQSARREAERVAAFIQGHISRENIAKRGLWFRVNSKDIKVWYGFKNIPLSATEANSCLKANQGCTYNAAKSKLYYHIVASNYVSEWEVISDDSTVSVSSGTKGQHYITVEGADNKSLNVIIGRKL